MDNTVTRKRSSELGHHLRHDVWFYLDHCPECNKEIWRVMREFGKLCRDCQWPMASKVKNVPNILASSLGYKSRARLYQDCCPKCGKKLWHCSNDMGRMCYECGEHSPKAIGEANGRWNGGKAHHKCGYVSVQVGRDSLYYPMARKNGYVMEHRLIIAQSIGRCLEKWEIVHHVDGDKSNNSFDNLKLLPNVSEHQPFTRMQMRVMELEKQVKLLKWQIANLQQDNRRTNPEIESGKLRRD